MGRKAKTTDGEVVESFYGVYLLLCANPRYKGRTYIGFTVDPNRRIQQHNLGKEKGGAWRTHNKGPWNMVLIIHGFPNEVSALRFEWAWQHPHRSRRLRHVQKKKSKESSYDFALRVVSEMLRVGPWCRLPLNIRWLLPDHSRSFPADSCPPFHMAICYGPVVSKKIPSKKQCKNTDTESLNDLSSIMCFLCKEPCSKDEAMTCILKDCNMEAHTICFAKHFLKDDPSHLLPISGSCPKCETNFLWGDLVRKKKGCYQQLDKEEDVFSLSDFETELAS